LVAISQGTVILFLTSSWYMLNNTSCAFLTIRNSNIWYKLFECSQMYCREISYMAFMFVKSLNPTSRQMDKQRASRGSQVADPDRRHIKSSTVYRYFNGASAQKIFVNEKIMPTTYGFILNNFRANYVENYVLMIKNFFL
jgi:hypothetical protein